MALDIDQAALDELASRVAQAGLSERVAVVRCSMLDMDFADESFDVVWCEAAVQVIGFSSALRDWRRLIRPDGFLVIHEVIWLKADPPNEIASQWLDRYPSLRTASQYIEEIQLHGYELIDNLQVPANTWWVDYYGPLEERISELRRGFPADRAIRRMIAEQEQEIDLFKRSYEWFGSCFFVMRRSSK